MNKEEWLVYKPSRREWNFRFVLYGELSDEEFTEAVRPSLSESFKNGYTITNLYTEYVEKNPQGFPVTSGEIWIIPNREGVGQHDES